MRKILEKSFSVIMAFTLLFAQTTSLSARASNIPLPSVDESVLVLDETALDAAMMELNELDEFLSVNEGITFTELKSSESELIVNMDNSTSPLGMDSANEPPLGIPSFLWGCVFTLVGVLLVYVLTDGDKDETRKALWGMIVSLGVYVIFYVGVYSWAF